MSGGDNDWFGDGPGPVGPRSAAQADVDRARRASIQLTEEMVAAASAVLAARPGAVDEALWTALAFAPYPAHRVSRAEAMRRIEACLRELSEASFMSGWARDIEYRAWGWLMEELVVPPGKPGTGLDPRTIDDLRRYAQACEGWIRATATDIEFVPMAEWREDFARWKRAQPAPLTPEERERRLEEVLKAMERLSAAREKERAEHPAPRTNDAVTITADMRAAALAALARLPDAPDGQRVDAVIRAALSVAPFVAWRVTPARAVQLIGTHIERIRAQYAAREEPSDVEHRVWAEITHPYVEAGRARPRLEDDDAPTLRGLSAICQGWVRLGVNGVELVPLAEWRTPGGCRPS